MKSKLFVLVIILMFVFGDCLIFSQELENALSKAPIVSPERLDRGTKFFNAGDFYFAGQPDSSDFAWLAENGVKVVINLRTASEMAKHDAANFVEANLVKKMGMTYYNLPIGGAGGMVPAKVDTFAQILSENQGKAVIHCGGAYRVTYLWMAYLVRYRNMTIDDAIEIGKKITYTSPFEDLLGFPLTTQKRETED